MECPAAAALLEYYAKATMEYCEAFEAIVGFVGSDTEFEQVRFRARHTYAKRKAAHSALEAHLARHKCGIRSSLEKTNL